MEKKAPMVILAMLINSSAIYPMSKRIPEYCKGNRWQGTRRTCLWQSRQRLSLARKFSKSNRLARGSQSFAKDVRDRILEGTASGNLSNASCLCNFQRATEFHKQHLSIAKEVGDRAAEGHVYGNLDNAYRCVCDFNPKIIPLRKSCSAALRNSILSFTLEGWLLRDMMFSWTNHSARISVTEDDIFQQRF